MQERVAAAIAKQPPNGATPRITRYSDGVGERIEHPIRVAVVDNDPYSLQGLTATIARMKDCVVLWHTELGTDALRRCLASQGLLPDVMVVDMSLDDIPGVELCRRIRRRRLDIGLVGITAYSPGRFIAEAADAGMQTLIEKNHVFEQLPSAIHLATCGKAMQTDAAISRGVRFPDTASAILPEPSSDERIPVNGQRLSAREMQTMFQYAHGCSTEEVAAELGVGVSTVYSYQKRAMDKLHARTLPQAIYLLAGKGLL